MNLNDEDPNLQELLQAGRGGIMMEDFVKYSLDMKLLDVQVKPYFSSSFVLANHYVGSIKSLKKKRLIFVSIN